MPDTLNKQTLINLLIDSPLREPIKINLIDIVNNTSEPDLPKVYSTITKELEIFQKATERRMKLAEETIAKLGGTGTTAPTTPDFSTPSAPAVTAPDPMPNLPPSPTPSTTMTPPPTETPTLPVAPLDLPPAAEMPKLDTMDSAVQTPTPSMEPTPAPSTPPTEPAPNFQPLGGAPVSSASDEDALAEIQKELDSLKTEAAADVASAAAPVPAPQA